MTPDLPPGCESDSRWRCLYLQCHDDVTTFNLKNQIHAHVSVWWYRYLWNNRFEAHWWKLNALPIHTRALVNSVMNSISSCTHLIMCLKYVVCALVQNLATSIKKFLRCHSASDNHYHVNTSVTCVIKLLTKYSDGLDPETADHGLDPSSRTCCACQVVASRGELVQLQPTNRQLVLARIVHKTRKYW